MKSTIFVALLALGAVVLYGLYFDLQRPGLSLLFPASSTPPKQRARLGRQAVIKIKSGAEDTARLMVNHNPTAASPLGEKINPITKDPLERQAPPAEERVEDQETGHNPYQELLQNPQAFLDKIHEALPQADNPYHQLLASPERYRSPEAEQARADGLKSYLEQSRLAQ